MPVNVADERLVALVDHLDGAAGAESQHAGVGVHGEVLPCTECPAGARKVQPHLVLGQPQAWSRLRQVLMQPLCGDVKVDATAAVGHGQARLGSQEGLVLDPHLVGSLHDHLGGTVDAAAADRHRVDHIAVGVDGRGGGG